MTAAGLIFSNIHDQSIPEMTATRTMASLPFGGRYRMVDFALSNMVNSGITKVGIVTHNNYRSLMDHIGTGKDWDLARRGGGVIILPPFVTAYENPRAGKLYTTRLEALMGVMEFIKNCTENAIVLSDCDAVCNINLSAVLQEHEQDGADLTIVTKEMHLGEAVGTGGNSIVYADEDGNVTEFVEHTRLLRGQYDVSTNIMVFSKSFLLTLLLSALAHGYTSFYRQALSYAMGSARIRIYRHDGYYAKIDSLTHYFHANLALLRTETRNALFGAKDRPIYTKVRNSPPTRYGDSAGDCQRTDCRWLPHRRHGGQLDSFSRRAGAPGDSHQKLYFASGQLYRGRRHTQLCHCRQKRGNSGCPHPVRTRIPSVLYRQG